MVHNQLLLRMFMGNFIIIANNITTNTMLGCVCFRRVCRRLSRHSNNLLTLGAPTPRPPLPPPGILPAMACPLPPTIPTG